MADKKTILHRYNGTSFDTIYPKTTTDQVDGLQTELDAKQDTISDLTTIRSGATAGSTAVQPAAISDMATKTWTGQQGYLTEQSLSAYRTSADQDTIDNTLLPKSAVKDNVTSTSGTDALSANQGKLLNDRINNLEGLGRYLALWDCTTGKPTSNPITMPYTYKAGDYYRVSKVLTPGVSHTITLSNGSIEPSMTILVTVNNIVNTSSDQFTYESLKAWLVEHEYTSTSNYYGASGTYYNDSVTGVYADTNSNKIKAYINISTTWELYESLGLVDSTTNVSNKRPSGTSYNNEASTVVETEDVQVGDVYFCDGTQTSTNWSLQINHIGGLVEDVKIDTTSIVSSGTATLVSGQHTLPSQTSQSGKYLTTNGSVASWANVESLPSQTGNTGKFLGTNGETASWNNIMASGVYKQVGSDWTAISGLDTAKSYHSITYGNDRFVCVGQGGRSAYSTNGTTWTAMSGAEVYPTYYYSVAYGNDRFVCVGALGKSYYSTDGISWTAMSLLPTNRTFYSVAYGNGRFVCVGESGLAYCSTDGTTWSAISYMTSVNYYSVTYGNDRFVCVGATGKSYYSTDGTSWSTMNGLNGSFSYRGVTYGNGKFVCVGENGQSYYSTNGTSWTLATESGLSSVTYNAITYGNNKFVCVGASGNSYYSIDGITWTAITGLDTSKTYNGVTYSNSRFVCVGENGQSYYAIVTETILDYIDSKKEAINNKVTTISSSSTDTQYPSAKAVYDAIQASITNAIGGEF